MKNQFNLNIKNPCTENFNTFSTTKKGGFCNSCTKEVIDFSRMDSKEIIKYFKTNSTKNTCGRFNNNQLRTYNYASRRKSVSYISGIAFAFLSLFSFSKTQAQDLKNETNISNKEITKFQTVNTKNNITVKGVVSESGVPLPGANIVLQGTNIGTSTDFDGNFEFPVELKKGDVLVFSYIGFTSKKVMIQDQKSANDVALKVNLKMDGCVLMGKVAVKKVYSSKRN
ncbi:CarboxypepD_reg-like domain-containing protein [Aquimarina amphilecti]|uniref:CarboxypepD_reg-like domain-containing protein n=1 Tax=Aquimarina amphilecti TaxID=1038014 RepID=A0A1H7UTP8_AQUAM|nr:carboxypeptidase-like regulatory domain-containing protein [Aquimarina amphilecti]SEL99797.1 CarboxypepD_reg-like domain-containing protein [Aquimarina amphilecti]